MATGPRQQRRARVDRWTFTARGSVGVTAKLVGCNTQVSPLHVLLIHILKLFCPLCSLSTERYGPTGYDVMDRIEK